MEALIDTRPQEEQDKNYSYREHIGFAPVPTYLTKSEAIKSAKLYTQRNQLSSLTCGAHAAELLMSIENGGKRFEEAFIYYWRINKPNGGMVHYDIGNILKLRGIPSDEGISGGESVYNAYTPTQAQIDEAKTLAGNDYIILDDDKYTIDDLAYISNNLKLPIILFVYWKNEEWSNDYPVAPDILNIRNAEKCHYVVVLPESGYQENGESYVIIQDSSPFGYKYIRHLSRSWIKERTYTGLYRLKLIKEKSNVSFSYVFTKDLSVGMIGKDVEMLQKALEELGFFPKGLPYGYFGGITRQAVKDFQKAYFSTVLQVLGLKVPTGYFGASTRKQLNKLMK